MAPTRRRHGTGLKQSSVRPDTEPRTQAAPGDAGPKQEAMQGDETHDTAPSAAVQIPFHWGGFATLFVSICFLFILRRPDALLNPQFWAEDGKLLFQSQLIHGGLALAIQPYRGYFIMGTRLAAAFAGCFPIKFAPLIYNLAAIVIEGLACSLFSLPWYAFLVRSRVLRTAVCIAAAGALYTESLVNNLCNTQWYLAVACLLLLFRQPPRQERFGAWLTSLCVLVAALGALTNPVLVVTMPICIWQIFIRRRNRAVTIAILAGIAAQVVCFLAASPAAASTAGSALLRIDHFVAAMVIAAIYNVLISSVAGWKAANFISAADGVGVFLCVFTGAIAWLTWLWLQFSAAERVQMGTALYIGAASLILPLRVRGLSQAYVTVTHLQEPRGEQYFVIAGFVLLLLLAMTAETLWGERRQYTAAAFFMVLVTGGLIGNFRVPPFPDYQWRHYVPEVEAWHAAARAGISRLGVAVPINPQGWAIRLPAIFQNVLITGFPDHVVVHLDGENTAASSIEPALVHNSDPTYVDLPPIFLVNSTYRVRAVVMARDTATASLFVHGTLSGGAFAESLPASIDADGVALTTEVRTDAEAGLCIHIRRKSGGVVTFRSITITPI